MALKIDTNQSAVAYHILDGAVTFPYAVDAMHAVGAHPAEWSEMPWPADATAAARKDSGIEQPELTPEDQAAIDEHNKAVEEAAKRLADYRAKKEAERLEAMQVAADEAMVASPPPAPEMRRPFGRKGDPTPAEIEMMKQRDAKKADDERIAAEKAQADVVGNAFANGTKTTT